MPLYAVKDGRQEGTFHCWPQAQAQTDRYPGNTHIRASCQEEADEFRLAYRAKVRRSRKNHCRISLTDHTGRILIEEVVQSKRGRKALRRLISCCENAVPTDCQVLVWFPFGKKMYQEESQYCHLNIRHIGM